MKTELNFYELVLFFKAVSTEQELKDQIEQYKKFLTEKGSQVMVKNNGKISLAYPIKGFDTARSVQLTYIGNGQIINQLNTMIQRDGSVLRAVTTKLQDQNVSEMFQVSA